MPFDGLVINSLVHELQNALIYNRIDKIYQTESDEIIIKFRNISDNNILLISANSNFPYICLAKQQKNNPLNPPMFCMLLRKHVQGGKIINVKQIDFERIIVFTIESYDELGNRCYKDIIVEIMGKHSNIILVDKNSGVIIDSIKRIPFSISRQRQVLPGLKYKYPPSQEKINVFKSKYNEFLNQLTSSKENQAIHKVLYKSFQGISPIIAKEICIRSNIDFDTPISDLKENHLKKIWIEFMVIKENIEQRNFNPNIIIDGNNRLIDFSSLDLKIYNSTNFIKIYNNSISKTISQFYFEKDKHERIKQKSMSLKKLINTRLERLYNKLQKQKEELIIAREADKYRLYGELILSNLYKISKGMTKIEVENYYDKNLSKIIIPLDLRLSPTENSQFYFKKYNKFKNALSKITEQLKETNEEIKYMENVLVNLENTDDIENIEDIKNELIEQKILKKRNKTSKKTKSLPSSPNKYLSSDGFIIESGKNNKQNDYLTLKSASKNDIWLHTKDIPGSHVIIKTYGKKVPETTIIEAAKIAAYHSKGRFSSNVPVDYTIVKHVKKPSGAKPGMVIYDYFKTVFVTPDEKEIKNLQVQSE